MAADKILLETQGESRHSRKTAVVAGDYDLKQLDVQGDGDETFLIRQGRHPNISYPNLNDLNDTEIHIRYVQPAGGGNSKTLVVEADDCPRHFLWLSDQAVEAELQYRLHPNNTLQKWSDRVLVEKTYFTLFYGGTGQAAQYLDPVDDFQTDLEGWDVMDRSAAVDANVHCTWEGLECNKEGELTVFRLDGFALEGTLPTDLVLLSKLQLIDFSFNQLQGSIPTEWGTGLTDLRSLNLAANELTGRLPETSLARLTRLEHLWLSENQLRGTLSERLFDKWTNLQILDLSENNFRGTIPKSLVTKASDLLGLYMEGNQLSGTLPAPSTDAWGGAAAAGLQMLEVMDIGNNKITGTIPEAWFSLPNLRDWNLANNKFGGTLPTQLMRLSSLEVMVLSNNKMTGPIPRGDDILPDDIRNLPGAVHPRKGPKPIGVKWGNLANLTGLYLNDNAFTGTLPPTLIFGVGPSLIEIDIGNNFISGQIPTLIGKMTNLERIDAQNNLFNGTLPSEMNRMHPDIQLNLTNNLLTGTVPKIFCGGGVNSPNILYRQFGCDAVLCPAGTFHPNGAASLYSGCRPCPVKRGDDEKMAKVLGRTECSGTSFSHGDLNGDGVLSEREVLRLLYTYTSGRNWGAQFESWADPMVDKCDLTGIVCVDNFVAKIDLTDAAMCSNGERKAGSVYECKGIPAEISLLTNLEVLLLSRRQFLRGTFPSEMGLLKKLRYMDISSSPLMIGQLPSELGDLSALQYLNFGGCSFNGTIPEELFRLTNIEKLHLSSNDFEGSLSSSIGMLTKVKELMLSRTLLEGPLPKELGKLTLVENLEMYGNNFSGEIPDLGNCTKLKRIDLFNNELTGTIPESLARLSSLQILHIKLNHLTGTVSSAFGDLPHLSWFDASTNRLHGTIAESFGTSKTLKDFRLGGNMIYDPIPKALCTNFNINGGLTRMYGCAGVICPLGTYSGPGHATHSEGCKSCPEGRTTMYLGSSSCSRFSEKDILTILYQVMGHSSSGSLQREHWLSQEDEDDVCSWKGVQCDPDNDTVQAIGFPLYGLHDLEAA